MKSIQTLQVWAIQGENDTVYPVERAREPVEALQAAGGNVAFTVLPGHDQDVWTDTYSDPAFYDSLLKRRGRECKFGEGMDCFHKALINFPLLRQAMGIYYYRLG